MKHYLISATIPLVDFCMVKLFGKSSRWFQLHAVVNMMVVYLVLPDTYSLIISPIFPLAPRNIWVDMSLSLALFIHVYHCIIDTLSSIELWHHVIFVALGIIPAIFYYDSQAPAILLFTGCGFPGAIEYTMLSLVKHGKMTSISQKRVNSWVNNYIRAPLSIYGATIIHLDSTSVISYYICFLIYLNGTFFSKMAVENYMWHRCNTGSIYPIEP